MFVSQFGSCVGWLVVFASTFVYVRVFPDVSRVLGFKGENIWNEFVFHVSTMYFSLTPLPLSCSSTHLRLGFYNYNVSARDCNVVANAISGILIFPSSTNEFFFLHILHVISSQEVVLLNDLK